MTTLRIFYAKKIAATREISRVDVEETKFGEIHFFSDGRIAEVDFSSDGRIAGFLLYQISRLDIVVARGLHLFFRFALGILFLAYFRAIFFLRCFRPTIFSYISVQMITILHLFLSIFAPFLFLPRFGPITYTYINVH